MPKDDGDKKLSVPQFSSFKASSSVSLSKEKRGTQSKGEERDEARGRHRHDHRSGGSSQERPDRNHRHGSHRHRDRDQSSTRRHGRRRSRSKQRNEAPSKRARVVPEHVQVPGVFVIDTKGDPLISRFGSIGKSDIPAFYRYGAGRILGSDGRLVIDRDGPLDKFSIRMPGEGLSSFKDGLRAKRPGFASHPARMRSHQQGSDVEDSEGFLRIQPTKEQKSNDESSSDEDDKRPSYKSMDSKPKIQQRAASPTEAGSVMDPESRSDMVAMSPLKATSLQLSRQVKESPGDIDAWMILVDHQDDLLKAGQSLDTEVLENEAHSYTEIKVSMLESALSNASDAKDKRRVLAALMRAGVKIWSPKTAERKWAEVSQFEAENFILWKIHLDFVMSNISTFEYERVKHFILARLQFVLGRNQPAPSTRDIAEAIYIFLRLTRFMHDSGFKELAVAAWQAMLELSFFRPRQHQSRETGLESLREFWESEVPRVGNVDAQGWKAYVEGHQNQEVPEPITSLLTEAPQTQDSLLAWGELEESRSHQAKMPARTMDESPDDDPFRVVMYSDIEPFLFMIPEGTLADVKEQLIDSFLLFCGPSSAFSSADWTDAAQNDPFLVRFEDKPGTQSISADGRHEDEDTHRSLHTSRYGCTRAAISLDLLFADKGWLTHMQSGNSLIVGSRWISNVTKQLVHSAKLKDLAVYTLALSFTTEPGNTKKVARSLLKLHPTDIRLYIGYALSEFAKGQQEVAKNVLASAASIVSAAPAADRLMFWRTWSWTELESGNIQEAVKRLCAATDSIERDVARDSGAVPQSHILKAHQAFSSGVREALASGDLDQAGITAECHALLSYLTAEDASEPKSGLQGSIAAAMRAVETSSSEFLTWQQNTCPAHARLLQFAARLLYVNATKGPSRRAFMQQHLRRYIDLFPRNMVFWTLFEWCDSSLRIIDETRVLLHDKALVSKRDCLASRVFAIQHEMLRGNINSTRTAFENAISSDAARASTSMWSSYIRFCTSHRELQGKAKDVFYRALRHCPWSKELMMEAFLSLRGVMDSRELRSVYDTMVSKGLRMHVDLDDFLATRRRGERTESRRR